MLQCNNNNCFSFTDKCKDRMGSVITDDTVEPLAFEVCNTDGVEGLSWAEVEQCEVSKKKYEDIQLEYLSILCSHCFLNSELIVEENVNFGNNAKIEFSRKVYA